MTWAPLALSIEGTPGALLPAHVCVCVCAHEQGTVASEAGLLPLLKSLSPSPIVPTGGVTGCLLTASSLPLSAAAPFLQAPASVQTVDREHL